MFNKRRCNVRICNYSGKVGDKQKGVNWIPMYLHYHPMFVLELHKKQVINTKKTENKLIISGFTIVSKSYLLQLTILIIHSSISSYAF